VLERALRWPARPGPQGRCPARRSGPCG